MAIGFKLVDAGNETDLLPEINVSCGYIEPPMHAQYFTCCMSMSKTISSAISCLFRQMRPGWRISIQYAITCPFGSQGNNDFDFDGLLQAI